MSNLAQPKQYTKQEYLWAVYLAIALILIATSYLVVVDQLVMVTYQLEWTKLDWLPLMWTIGPAVVCVAQAIVLLIQCRPTKNPTLEYVGYTGSKHEWL